MSEENFYEVSAEAEELFTKVTSKMALPFNINFKLVSNDKQKCLVTLSKVKDVFTYLYKIQVMVIFNDAYVSALDETAAEILIQQELDRIHFNMKTGKISIGAPELSTSVGVIKKYGIDEVARANKLEELYEDQKSDEEKEQDKTTAQSHADLLSDEGVSFLA